MTACVGLKLCCATILHRTGRSAPWRRQQARRAESSCRGQHRRNEASHGGYLSINFAMSARSTRCASSTCATASCCCFSRDLARSCALDSIDESRAAAQSSRACTRCSKSLCPSCGPSREAILPCDMRLPSSLPSKRFAEAVSVRKGFAMSGSSAAAGRGGQARCFSVSLSTRSWRRSMLTNYALHTRHTYAPPFLSLIHTQRYYSRILTHAHTHTHTHTCSHSNAPAAAAMISRKAIFMAKRTGANSFSLRTDCSILFARSRCGFVSA